MRAWMLSAAVALLVAGCGDAAEPGDTVRADDAVAGKAVRIELPAGTLTVTVGTPIQRLAEDDVDEPHRDAPRSVDGGRWVGVSWAFEQRLAGDIASQVGLASHIEPAVVSLVADGHRFRVGEPYRVIDGGRTLTRASERDHYVAVDGDDDDDLRLEVTYDGLTQVAELPAARLRASPASALSALRPAGPRACSSAGRLDLHGLTRAPVDCQVNTSVRLPYVAGLGWAEPGREWAVVDLLSGLGPQPPTWKRPGRAGSVHYVVFAPPQSTFTVEGKPPARLLLDRDQPDDYDYALKLLALDVPAGRPATLRIRQHFTLSAENVLDADLDQVPREVELDVERQAEI